MEKTWRCTVCGYLHKGDEPPEFCPVCKVDASKFELVEEAPAAPAGKKELFRQWALELFEEMRMAFVPHAVAAHFPNALIPTSVLFLVIYIAAGGESFEASVFYLLVVVAVTVPITFATGLWDWRKHFSGELTPIFRKKIILGLALVLLVILAASWRWSNPEVLTAGGLPACAYSILLLVILGCVTLLGHYGGLLVFAKHKS